MGGTSGGRERECTWALLVPATCRQAAIAMHRRSRSERPHGGARVCQHSLPALGGGKGVGGGNAIEWDVGANRRLRGWFGVS